MTAANLPREARALLDAIAQGESDPVAEREGISPYLILVGGGSFEGMPNRAGYNGFPEWSGKEFSTGISHAAGRYQFEPATWRGIVRRFPAGIPDFRNPNDQDWGAWFLAQQDYSARAGRSLLADLKLQNLNDIAETLRPTWTSLSNDTFPDRYTEALAAYPAGAPTPPFLKPPVPPMPDPNTSSTPPPVPPQTFHPKFVGGSIGGAVALIVIMELNRRGITIESDEASAITLVLGALFSWLAPSLTGPPS